MWEILKYRSWVDLQNIVFSSIFFCHISKIIFCDLLTAFPDIHGLESDSIIFSHSDESWMDLIQFCYLFFAVRLETLKRRLCNVMSGDIVELKAMMAVSSPTKKGHKENGNHNHGVESSKVGFLQLWCFQAWQAKFWILLFFPLDRVFMNKTVFIQIVSKKAKITFFLDRKSKK